RAACAAATTARLAPRARRASSGLPTREPCWWPARSRAVLRRVSLRTSRSRYPLLELLVHALRERECIVLRRALVRAARQQHDDPAWRVEEPDAADLVLVRDERAVRDVVALDDAGQLCDQLLVALVRLRGIEPPQANRDVPRLG